MSYPSLAEALQTAGSPVELLRNSQIGPYAFPVVRAEFTNWRDEQRAWRETCALFDQSHHMTDLYVQGPDALRLFSDLAENKFNLVGRPPAADWVQYNVETGRYNATAERDERSAVNQGRRKVFRYQVQGPNALKVMEKVTGKPAPDIKFFNMDVFRIAS